MTSDDLYASALQIIGSAQLSALEHLQLELFLNHAAVQSDAAHFVLRASQAPERGLEDSLRSIYRGLRELAQKFAQDVTVSPEVDNYLREREGGRCCVSGWDSDVRATHVVSPSILDDRDLSPGGALRPLLEAAISADVAEKLFLFLASQRKEDKLRNLWLMSPSVRSAFRNGNVSMRRIQFGGDESAIWVISTRKPGNFPVAGMNGDKFYAKLSTPDPTSLPLPESFLLSVHGIVSYPLHILSIEREINSGWPVRDETRIYILKAVDYWDPQEHPNIKFLPFGLCLKTGKRVSKNEGNALLLLEKHTSIAAPRLINATIDNEKRGFLLMTKVPGIPVEKVFYRMTYEERDQLAKDLGKCIYQYRRIPNDNKYLICDSVGGPVTDHRTDEPSGPYKSKADFLDYFTEDLGDARNKRPISVLYDKEHQVCFTHSDLHLSNILVSSGQLSGIVDWENSGFKPEYWEYTRAIWAYPHNTKLAQEFSLAFDKSYLEELGAERELWRLKPVY
ncbi:hypothetical protein FQN54_000614 [Arachnomyces sp. PD_36]|nr:hypothetical protein FQN54_000614 [Arachnomyces sp. PD_36]